MIFLAIGFVPFLTTCADDCANSVVAQSRSPDGRHRAVLFQRDCGATTGFSTQISILARDEALAGSGNAFIADDDHGAAATGGWGGPWAAMTWLAPDRLQISYAAKSRIFDQDDSVSGVAISYQPVSR